MKKWVLGGVFLSCALFAAMTMMHDMSLQAVLWPPHSIAIAL